jgi:hypothetical protein
MGYAFSALLDPPRVADSQVLKPLHMACRDRPAVRAQYPETPDARRRTQRGKAATRPEKLTEK